MPCLHFAGAGLRLRQIEAKKVLLATNALSLTLAHLEASTTPMLTLAVESEPIGEKELEKLGLAERKPFYTSDLPYLWGRLRRDRSIVWGAIRVDPPEGGTLEKVDIRTPEISAIFDALEDRIRRMHPVLDQVKFRARWGGPIFLDRIGSRCLECIRIVTMRLCWALMRGMAWRCRVIWASGRWKHCWGRGRCHRGARFWGSRGFVRWVVSCFFSVCLFLQKTNSSPPFMRVWQDYCTTSRTPHPETGYGAPKVRRRF